MSYYSHLYLVKDVVVPAEIFLQMENRMFLRKEMTDVQKFALLKAYAEKGLFETDAFKADENYETFIMINAGLSDGVVGEWPKTYSDTLTKNGSAHVFYETQGGHNFFVWKNGLYNFARNIFGMKAE